MIEEKENKLMKLFQELERQKNTKKDYVVPSELVKADCHEMEDGNKTIFLHIPKPMQPDVIGDTFSSNEDEKLTFGITKHAHAQISEKTKIPKNFYDRLKEDYPELLVKNINELIAEKDKRMIRTLDGNVRAVVSPKYRCIDNYDVCYQAGDLIKELNNTENAGIHIKRADLTETRFYMKATSEKLIDQIFPKKDKQEAGDIVKGGIIISNSEVGDGAFRVMPYMEVLKCTNGMISDDILKRIHVGREKGIGEINWSEETLRKQDETLWLKIKDMITGTFNPEIFRKWVDRINEVASEVIEKPTIAINNVVKNYNVTKEKTEQLLHMFAQEGYTKWGLSNAITSVAQTETDYEKQINMEKVGAEILHVPLEQLQHVEVSK